MRPSLPAGLRWEDNTIVTDGRGKTQPPRRMVINGEITWVVGCACYPIGGGGSNSCGDPYCFRTQPPFSKVDEYIAAQLRAIGLSEPE